MEGKGGLLHCDMNRHMSWEPQSIKIPRRSCWSSGDLNSVRALMQPTSHNPHSPSVPTSQSANHNPIRLLAFR